MKIYVAGPMSGLPSLNFPAFHAAAASLRALGHEVVNPAEINGGECELDAVAQMDEDQKRAHWIACMRRDITQLMTCDGVALLDGYESSRGAMLELCTAQALRFDIRRLEEWVPAEVSAA